jgi:hypothetical protein
MSDHICEPVYVTEGEVVCFQCGAVYNYHGTYDHDALIECSEIVEARRAGAASPEGPKE